MFSPEEDPIVQFGFHPTYHGKRVVVSDDCLRAERWNRESRWDHGVAYGAKPLVGTSEFEVEITSRVEEWVGSLALGVMRCGAGRPLLAKDVPHYTHTATDHCVWFVTELFNYLGGQSVRKPYGRVDLEDLRAGHRVSMRLSSEGELEFFVNGEGQGVAATGVYQSGYDVYAVVDHYGRCAATRITRAVVDLKIDHNEAARIYEEALKSGYLEYRSAVTILTGIAGSGKTSFKHLLCNMPPPEIRQSTPLAEAPIRAMCCVRVDATGEQLKMVNDEEHDQSLADRMATMFSQPASRSQVSESACADLPRRSTSDDSRTPLTLEPLSGDDVASDGSHQGGFQDHSSGSSSVSQEISGRFVYRIVYSSPQQDSPTPSRPNYPCRIDMFYLVDSGGQPQYQDLSSLFLSPAALTIFVTNLADTLDSHPMIGYYENGRPLSKPQPSPLSHLEVLQHTVQSLQSQAHARGQASSLLQGASLGEASLSSGSPPSVPNAESSKSSVPEAVQSEDGSLSAEASSTGPAILVVGTHKDKQSVFLETRAEKNQKLISQLEPVFGDQLIYHGESKKEVIFPVNAKKPNRYDQKVVSEIKDAMVGIMSSIKPQRVPLKWDILERAMRRMATSRGRAFLTRDECLQLAQDLEMSQSQLDVAVDHLTRLNLIFYFRAALPGIIFIRTEAFLDKLSELVFRRYELHNSPDDDKRLTGMWIRYRDKGLVSKELLQQFPKHYTTEPAFTPSHLVDLLLYRLVIVEVGVDEYFMPFILFSLPLEDLEKYRVQPSSNAAPLAITFPGGAIPSGLFPAVVASLLSSRAPYSLELYPSPRDRSAPECVYRNCIKFRLPSGTPGSLTLIDSYTHIEVHLIDPQSVGFKLCPSIRKAILGHLEDACHTLQFHRLSPQVSVLCESKVTHGEPSRRPFWHGLRSLFGRQSGEFHHHAEVSMDNSTWACILAPESISGRLQPRHLLWFPMEMPSDVGPSLRELQCLKWNNNGRQERSRIMDEVAPKWRDLGIALEFSITELDTIERDCFHQSQQCIQRLFGEWTLSKPTYSWTGLLEGLRNSGHSNLANRVTNAIANRSW